MSLDPESRCPRGRLAPRRLLSTFSPPEQVSFSPRGDSPFFEPELAPQT